ncbi:hypothetical protein QQP08_015145 [Theobroma cacao]|nr:hypothetical protein QQP08_015145 [Theobroma cacao]
MYPLKFEANVPKGKKKKKMGCNGGVAAPPLIGLGRRQSDLKKPFNVAVRSLLTTCPKQEFSKAFQNFTSAEQERIHQLFIQETQVATALETVEQLVEEQHLDPLFSDKTNIMDVVHNLSTAKKAGIQAEEHNRLIRARVELLKNRKQEVSSMKDVEKVRGGILTYGEHKISGFSDLQLVG